jgi:hypothetical protein
MKSVPLAAIPSAEESVNPSGKGGQADGMLISAALSGNINIFICEFKYSN